MIKCLANHLKYNIYIIYNYNIRLNVYFIFYEKSKAILLDNVVMVWIGWCRIGFPGTRPKNDLSLLISSIFDSIQLYSI